MGSSEVEGRIHTEALLTEHLTMLRAYLQHLPSSPHDADDVFQDVCVADAAGTNRWIAVTFDGSSCKEPDWVPVRKEAHK
jgi:hypothetical protein